MIDFLHLNAKELEKIGIQFNSRADAAVFTGILNECLRRRIEDDLLDEDGDADEARRRVTRREQENLEAELLEYRSEITGTTLFGAPNPYAEDIDCLKLSLRARNQLRRAGLTTVARVAACRDLYRIRNLGVRGVEEVTRRMEEYFEAQNTAEQPS